MSILLSGLSRETTPRESSDPYYDLIDDFDLIVSSFQSQYGLRLSRELGTMKWDEFKDLLVGISPDTALGRIVAIRSETDKNVLKHFTRDQRRIRSEWMQRRARGVRPEDMASVLEGFKQTFIRMSGALNDK